jgi:hypothetical protein
MLGHYHLWVGGVQHNDISVENLMYDVREDEVGDGQNRRYVGILNDYDLAHLHGRIRPTGAERTGTMPFMALDLLTEKAWNGQVKRLYRHDCESFAWVLLWICCRYDQGKEIKKPPLSDFITDTYEQCRRAKFGADVKEIEPTQSYVSFWEVASELIIDRLRDARPENRAEICKPEKEPLEVFECYRKVLEEYGFSLHDLS